MYSLYMIILSDSEDEFEHLSATVETPYVPSNMSTSNDEEEPFNDDQIATTLKAPNVSLV
ncbi:hypothetical protein Tco_1000205, partial [Tanacetum coccineum]